MRCGITDSNVSPVRTRSPPITDVISICSPCISSSRRFSSARSGVPGAYERTGSFSSGGSCAMPCVAIRGRIVRVEQLTVQGHEGRPLRCVVDEGGRGTAIVFPGAFYVPQAPLLWFAHECLAERGLGVVEVWWEFPDELDAEEAVEWVHGHARAVAERWPPDVLVGKSLGTEALASLGPRASPRSG